MIGEISLHDLHDKLHAERFCRVSGCRCGTNSIGHEVKYRLRFQVDEKLKGIDQVVRYRGGRRLTEALEKSARLTVKANLRCIRRFKLHVAGPVTACAGGKVELHRDVTQNPKMLAERF